MKLLFAIFVSALALSAADSQTDTTAPKKAATNKVQVAQPLTIPEGAVPGSDGDYHFTDAEGKKWLYRKTPFGISRREDAPAVNTSMPAAGSVGMKATEDGDMVHFEKQGPFGIWKWEKKKSELDDAEKAALQQAQAGSKATSKQE